MYVSRFLMVVSVIIFLMSWVGFKFPELFIHGRRSAGLTKAIGEEASKKVAKYVGVPLGFLMAAAFMGVGIYHESMIQNAEKGDAAAQYTLAGYFYRGEIQAKDFETAVSWYLRAAQNGHPEAGAFIDAFIENPRNVVGENEDAFAGYLLLAEANLPEAQWRLGECYRKGFGTAKDETAAFTWYTAAAQSGYESAFGILGYCYAHGLGTQKNIEEAIRWYEQSAAKGSALSQANLGILYLKHFSGDWHRMREARNLFRKASLKNETNGQASYGMGYMILNGIGGKADPTMAFVWFSMATDRGSKDGRQMRDSIARKMTAAQLKWARETIQELNAHHFKTKGKSVTVTGPVKTNTVVRVVRPEEN